MRLMNSNVTQGFRSAVASVAIFAMVAGGCSQKETTSEKKEAAPTASKISVKPSPKGVVISTGQAQFTLAGDGSLTATLDQNGAAATLEAASASASSTAPVVTIGKKNSPARHSTSNTRNCGRRPAKLVNLASKLKPPEKFPAPISKKLSPSRFTTTSLASRFSPRA